MIVQTILNLSDIIQTLRSCYLSIFAWIGFFLVMFLIIYILVREATNPEQHKMHITRFTIRATIRTMLILWHLFLFVHFYLYFGYSFVEYLIEIYPRFFLFYVFMFWVHSVLRFYHLFQIFTLERYVAKIASIFIPLSFVVYLIFMPVLALLSAIIDFVVEYFSFLAPLFFTIIIMSIFLFFIWFFIKYDKFLEFFIFSIIYLVSVILPLIYLIFILLTMLGFVCYWCLFNCWFVFKFIIILNFLFFIYFYIFLRIKRVSKVSSFFYSTFFLFMLSVLQYVIFFIPFQIIDIFLLLPFGIIFFMCLYLIILLPVAMFITFISESRNLIYTYYIKFIECCVGKNKRFWFFNRAVKLKRRRKPVQGKWWWGVWRRKQTQTPTRPYFYKHIGY